MPPGAPGTLNEEEYIDIISFILSINGFKTVSSVPALGPDNLYKARIAEFSQLSGNRESAKVRWKPVTQDYLIDPPDGDWPSKTRTPNAWRFSPLTQINRDNVKDLELAWVLESGVVGAVEWTPAVANGVMFLQANSTRIIAVNAATGNLLWVYRYMPLSRQQQVESGVGSLPYSRGVVLYEDMVIGHFFDSHIVALDAVTGRERWKTFTDGGGYNSPGIIADGILVSGNTAKDDNRGFVTGIDPASGKILWRTYTIPARGEPGYETWHAEGTAEKGHGSVWGTPSYDPQLNLVYVGVSAPDPYTNETRPGDNLYTNSLLALDPQTGKIQWYHQFIPNDSWDQDSTMEALLIDVKFNGILRKAMIHTGKSGFTNLLDRATGEWLDSMFTVYQNIFLSVDSNGRPKINLEVIPRPNERTIACPSIRGGTDWPARAYSPATGLYYLSGNNVCMDVEGIAYSPGDSNRNLDEIYITAPGYNHIGELFAINPLTMEISWSVKYDISSSAAPLPTAGGLVFAGGMDHYFRAYTDDTGELLWEQRLNAPIEGHPISYEIDGTQYLAVPSGCCSAIGLMVQDLTPERMSLNGSGLVWVFSLPRE